jgi:hypothetical protein
MKPHKFLLCICVMLTSLILYSQSPADIKEIQKRSNLARLKQLSIELKEKSQKSLQKALQYARSKNWPLVKTIENGDKAYLIGVTDDGKPMYAYALNDGAATTIRTNRLHTNGGLGLNLQGDSMNVGLWDQGRARPDHELFTGRVTVMDPSTNTTNINHSTHVAGTLIGADLGPAKRRVRGMAFMATLDDYDWNDDVSEMATAAANGLLLSNHSYTFYPFGYAYDFRSYDIDDVTFNAPYYLPVLACGNGGVSTPSLPAYLANEGIAKNGIAVGNIYELRNYVSPSDVVIYAGSSFGPTDDYRVKPDLVSKGQGVYSSVATTTTSYDLGFGTSMAAPGIAGTLLLLQQHYHNINSSFMLSHTLKNVALHTADEAGANPGPDYRHGWGLMNAEFAANTITHRGKSAIIREDTIANHDTLIQTVTASGIGPLKVSICWTDRPPGDYYSYPTATKLINDLDIRVSDGTNTYYPWKINQSNVTGAALNNGDNDRDNFERIDIPGASFGDVYTITITHKNNLYDDLPQSFSLVVTGITNCDLGDPTLTITSPITSSVDHTGYDLITASSAISDGITVNFKANANVLNSGFVVNRGGSSGYFLAVAGPCEDDEEMLRSVTKKEEAVSVLPEETTTDASANCVPNPSDGSFKVYIKNMKEGVLQIVDVSGRPVHVTNFKNTNVIDVNLQHVARGIYFVRIAAQNGTIVKKIIIK